MPDTPPDARSALDFTPDQEELVDRRWVGVAMARAIRDAMTVWTETGQAGGDLLEHLGRAVELRAVEPPTFRWLIGEEVAYNPAKHAQAVIYLAGAPFLVVETSDIIKR